MVTVDEYLFAWEPQLKLLNELLLKWRYIRDMSLDTIPIYFGAKSEPIMPEELKKVAVVQVDLLQSTLHNIEHHIMGIQCNCVKKEDKSNE